MLRNDKIDRVYKAILSKKELSYGDLTCLGLTGQDIDELLDSDIIKLEDNFLYSLGSVYKLYEYANDLDKRKQNLEAFQYFKLCYEADKNFLKPIYKLLLSTIKYERYEESFIYFDILINNGSDHDKNECAYFLYLMSKLIEIPNKYNDMINNLEFENIKLDSTSLLNPDKIDIRNSIRKLCLKNKFNVSIDMINNLLNSKAKCSDEVFIEKILINRIGAKISERRNFISNFIAKGEYDLAANYLLEQSETSPLDTYDRHTLALINTYYKIKKGEKIPDKVESNTNNMFKAINNHDYMRALSLNKKKYSSIYYLLEEICKLLYNRETTLDESSKNNCHEFVMDCYNDLLKNKGIIILYNVKGKDFKIIRDEVHKLKNAVSFYINYDGVQGLVLRYRDNVNNVDMRKVFELSKISYINRDYETSKNYLLELLSVGMPKSYVYHGLGKCYLKLGELEKAIDYLTVTSNMLKNEHAILSINDLIEDIIQEIEIKKFREDEKNYIKL